MKTRRIAGTILLLFLFTGCIFFLKAGSFLSSVPINPSPADLIVLLSGDAGARSLQGVALYKRGYGKRILLTGLEDGETSTQQIYLNWRMQFLISSGISKDNILFEARSNNSWQEAQNTFVLMKQNRWRSVIVVSDPPHLRRLRWVWGRIFKGSGIEVQFSASRPSWWDEKRWWSNEHSFKFVIMEYLKLFYYFIKYP